MLFEMFDNKFLENLNGNINGKNVGFVMEI